MIHCVCLVILNNLHAVRGAQETREGVFGHQSVDSLLCLVECVGTRRVHHTQQTLAGLSIQVYLRGRTDYQKKAPNPVNFPAGVSRFC